MKRFARFLRLKAFSVNPDFDVIALPTVMIHKGGQLVHNLTKNLDHLPKRFGVNDVTELLESCGVVDPVSAGSTILRTSALKATCTSDKNRGISQFVGRKESFVENCAFRDYDSDDAELDELCADFHPVN